MKFVASSKFVAMFAVFCYTRAEFELFRDARNCGFETAHRVNFLRTHVNATKIEIAPANEATEESVFSNRC